MIKIKLINSLKFLFQFSSRVKNLSRMAKKVSPPVQRPDVQEGRSWSSEFSAEGGSHSGNGQANGSELSNNGTQILNTISSLLILTHECAT